MLLMTVLGLAGVAMAAEKVDVAEARKLIGEKVQVLDVRTLEEWNEGHLDGALRVDVSGKDFDEAAAKALDEGKPVLVYCRSGGRSAKATKRLEKLGCVTVYDLEGGIIAWTKAGGKVVK